MRQVIELRFAGYPAPPLDKVFTICNSIHGWLNADPKNVAVIHCQVHSFCSLAPLPSCSFAPFLPLDIFDIFDIF